MFPQLFAAEAAVWKRRNARFSVQFGIAHPSGPKARATRVGRRIGLAAAALLLLGSVSLQPADAVGETRSLTLYNIHTKDQITVAFKKNGRFDDQALAKLNSFLRDWRAEQETRMDPQLFDMLWEVYREVKATGPIHVVSGYRSPNTNSMLRGRSRSSGVAKTSLHMQGKAVDFSIPTAEVAAVRAAALRVQGGGVGYYPTSGVPFVHMDVGNVRHWPRMTRDQLIRVFPNGRTLHVPSDGEPLPGYELAMADRERGARPGTQPQSRNLIASLFGSGQTAQPDPEAVADAPAAAPARTAATRRPAPAAQPPQTQPPVAVAMTDVPLPHSRPARPAAPSFQLASAASVPVPAPLSAPLPMQRPAATPQPAAAPTALSPMQIIAERGYWQGPPDAVSAQTRVAAAPRHTDGARRGNRQRVTVDPETTAGLGPFARNDRVTGDIAMGYAAEGGARPALAQPMGLASARSTPATVTTAGAASVATKPAMPDASRPRTPGLLTADLDRLNDPWLRGVVMATSISRAMTMTTMGARDFRSLETFMRKPGSAVMMTFSDEAVPAPASDAFTGSAVVFQSTVSFGTRTAGLR
jgi:uncharacterized protein YcbK (DUF882 family)